MNTLNKLVFLYKKYKWLLLIIAILIVLVIIFSRPEPLKESSFGKFLTKTLFNDERANLLRVVSTLPTSNVTNSSTEILLRFSAPIDPKKIIVQSTPSIDLTVVGTRNYPNNLFIYPKGGTWKINVPYTIVIRNADDASPVLNRDIIFVQIYDPEIDANEGGSGGMPPFHQ